MEYDFDMPVPRAGTDCIKYDFNERFGKPPDILPLWVADMDFRTAPAVTEAIARRCAHGIFGYSDTRSDYDDILHGWFQRQFGWDTDPSWLVKMPGVVCALSTAIRALTEPGDAILIQEPVYHPFRGSVEKNGRTLVVSPLVFSDGVYRMDFEDMESKIARNNVRMFILCSPHNPVGRVWERAELERAGEICLAHGVTVISDEIHADFVYPGHRHTVFAGIRDDFARIAVTCTSPSKTFNLAGLHLSNIFIADESMRRRYVGEIAKAGLGNPGIFGIVACKAAYSDGDEWLAQLREYLYGNLCFLRDFLSANLPGIRLAEPQGTYLAWLDFRSLGLGDAELDDFLVHKARIWLDGGHRFGTGGSGFQRVNIACPRATLGEAMQRLAAAVASMRGDVAGMQAEIV